jgi:hypothetical protein
MTTNETNIVVFQDQLRAWLERDKQRRMLALTVVAEETKDMVIRRIRRGYRTDGNKIGAGTSHKDGTTGVKYERRYAKKRQKATLQTGWIDFSFTGKLLDEGVRVEINKATQSAKIFAPILTTYLDKMKGKTFALSPYEKAFIKKRYKEVVTNR